MTENEQAVLKALRALAYGDEPLSVPARATVIEALALLDAKDAEIAAWKEHAIRNSREADAKDAEIAIIRAGANADQARAEQAEAEADRLAKALIKTQGELNCAEAALAEERKAHQAFREEVSEACHNARYYTGDGEFLNIPEVKRILERFILPAKPADPLIGVLADIEEWAGSYESFAAQFRAAIERAGGTISFERNG